MTLEERLIALAQAVGADVKALRIAEGNLSALSTTNKTNLVAAINELAAALGSAGAPINDAAGSGNILNTWSANQIYTAIEAAKTAVTNSLVNGASAALDTFAEFQAAINNDASFAATIATQLTNRVRYDTIQVLTEPQKIQALANIGAVSTLSIGNADQDLAAAYAAAKL